MTRKSPLSLAFKLSFICWKNKHSNVCIVFFDKDGYIFELWFPHLWNEVNAESLCCAVKKSMKPLGSKYLARGKCSVNRWLLFLLSLWSSSSSLSMKIKHVFVPYFSISCLTNYPLQTRYFLCVYSIDDSLALTRNSKRNILGIECSYLSYFGQSFIVSSLPTPTPS